jgi:CubicO group peptidase (beta-lactamase class C family)
MRREQQRGDQMIITSKRRKAVSGSRRIGGLGTFAALAVLLAPAARAQTLSVSQCANATMSMLDAAASDVPPALQELRRRMLDADMNALTFHNMDEIFWTRTVPHAGPVWELPSATTPLSFTYVFDEATWTPEAFLERTYTNALIVVKDGVIRAEIYRNNTNPGTRFVSYSMAKSITSMLVGLAFSEGRIASLDDPVEAYVPELADSAYQGVTIRQILEMRSGVDYEERYDFDNPGVAAANHNNALVLNLTRFADAACAVERKTEPGAVFEYKTLDTAVLGWLVERAAGMSAASYMASRIWEPLGAEADGYFIMDGPPGVGREFTGAGFNATLRDYARLGQMVLDDGVANGRRILPEGWVAQSTAPSHPETDAGGYGLQWWTAPDSNAFYALGLQGQYLYIDPDSRTVVVKLSYFPPGDTSAGAETMAFMRAAAAWRP